MLRKTMPLIFACLSLIATRPASPSTSYSITYLGTLGGEFSEAHSIANNGQVVGWSTIDPTTPFTGPRYAFLWQGGVMHNLGTLGGVSSSARDVNDLGQVVGSADTSAGYYRAFSWQNGTMVDIGTLGGFNSYAMGVNNLGQVVGSAETGAGNRFAFLWEAAGSMRSLGTLPGYSSSVAMGINNVGQVVGYAYAPSKEQRAFIWDAQHGIRELPFAVANGINDEGQVVGYGGIQVGLWHNGISISLGLDSTNNGINGLGQIVGTASSVVGRSGLFVWQNGATDYLQLPDSYGSNTAWSINDAGQVAGYSIDYSSGLVGGPRQAMLWNPVPEPTSLVAMLCGVGVAIVGRACRPGSTRLNRRLQV